MIYCGIARLFFEFSLPILCIFYFTSPWRYVIVAAFLLWQFLSWYGIKYQGWLKQKGEGEDKSTNGDYKEYAYDLWAKVLPNSDFDYIETDTVWAHNETEAEAIANDLSDGFWTAREIRNVREIEV